MTKFQLVKAMQREHPLRTLDIGTLKANTSRALKKEIPYDADLQQKLQHAITTCLSDISKLASRTKLRCQQAVGQYLEHLSVDHLDEDDRTILSYLTPYFSVQEIEEAKKGITPNPEEKPSDNKNNPEASIDNKNSPEAFFLSLLVAIYKASAPQKTKNAGASAAVGLFLHKAKDYLPPKTGSGRFASCNCGSNVTCCKTNSLTILLSISYLHALPAEPYNNPSIFLSSIAIQLATEYTNHFKNGSFDLCKKVITIGMVQTPVYKKRA